MSGEPILPFGYFSYGEDNILLPMVCAKLSYWMWLSWRKRHLSRHRRKAHRWSKSSCESCSGLRK